MSKEQNNPIADAQIELGIPKDPHYDQKTPLLKLTIGPFTSALSLVSKWDESKAAYLEPEPKYSCYIEEKIKTDEGRTERNFVMVSIPKNSAAFKQIGEHFLKLAQAAEGLELEKSTGTVDDLDAALNALKHFKK